MNDKKEIALAIRNSSFEEEMECSLINEKIIYDCKDCSLKSICEKIDRITEEYTKENAKVIGSFYFKKERGYALNN